MLLQDGIFLWTTITMIAHVFLFALFATVLSAPAALDQDTLLKNAQSAQALNARFQNMSRTDKCNGEFGTDPVLLEG